ncbi:MAG: nitrite reductase small subunit NirD [Sinobacterium sp.]|nr:nitrite reductase small subunit NirD [Sinobacterium sp.]
MSWNNVCTLNDIVANGARCALIDGEQVAIFRIQKDGEDQLFALSNFDPFSKANVMSRGLVGSIGDTLVVTSPIYKEHFNLITGQCIEDDSVCLKTWKVQLEGSQVQVSAAA